MSWSISDINLWSVVPELIICATGLIVLTLGFLSPRPLGRLLPYLSLAGIVVAFLSVLVLWGRAEQGFSRMMVLDSFALFFHAVFLLAAGVAVLVSLDYLVQEDLEHYEYYG